MGAREGVGEASVAVRVGGANEHRKPQARKCRGCCPGRRQHRLDRQGEGEAGSKGTVTTSPRRSPLLPGALAHTFPASVLWRRWRDGGNQSTSLMMAVSRSDRSPNQWPRATPTQGALSRVSKDATVNSEEWMAINEARPNPPAPPAKTHSKTRPRRTTKTTTRISVAIAKRARPLTKRTEPISERVRLKVPAIREGPWSRVKPITFRTRKTDSASPPPSTLRTTTP